MKTTRSWKAFAGLVLHALLAGIMILSASGKLLGSFPPPSGHEIRHPVSFFAQWFTYESYNTEPQTGG